MKTRQFKTLAAGLLLMGLAAAQDPGSALKRALLVLKKADVDPDGRLSAVEARTASIPTADFAKYDVDHDGSLSRDEFLIYYRQLLRASGRGVTRDLELECARIFAKRKAREARKARREATEKTPAVPARKNSQAPGKGPAAQRGVTEKRPTDRGVKERGASKQDVLRVAGDGAGRKEPD